jgi:hypothetical protein
LSLEQTIKREMIAEFTNTINPFLNDIEQLKGKIWKKATHILYKFINKILIEILWD